VTALERDCRQVIFGGLGVVVLASAALASLVAPPDVGAFLAGSVSAWLIVSDTLWRARALAAGGGAQGLGAATYLTLLRGLLVSLVAGLAFVPPAAPSGGAVLWIAFALYTAAAIGDRLDGLVARRLGRVTALGARLDGAMDALGLLAGPLVGVVGRRLPPWYLLVGAAYYLYQAGMWWRRRLGWPVYPERVRPKPATRFFAGAQMVLVCAALPPVIDPAVTTAAATVLMLPTLVLFGRDWLIVTGARAAPVAPTSPTAL
jgi:CDP-diacylglycerol--glycerol-3-phosphate 3-phosphatidyltransferase